MGRWAAAGGGRAVGFQPAHSYLRSMPPPIRPRHSQDGLYFLAYATNLRAVELCERLRQESKVAVVLDLGAPRRGA